MYSLVFLATVSFFLALFLTPVFRNAARRWGLVDHPDQGRKMHKQPIARIGGAAILAAYVLAFFLLLLSPLQSVRVVWGALPLVVRVAPAILAIFATGLADDLWNLKPWQKFAGQGFAAALAYVGGIHIQGFGGFVLPDILSLPATLFWLVLCANAVNLIDGVDGLAAGVGLFSTTTILIAALLQNNFDLALVVAPLAGCLLGFLRYNFNPATIFLGDCGSLLIGFFLGCCSVVWSEKAATILGMTAPLVALSIPLMDTGLAIARRFLRGKPIFGADRGHIHHRLLDRGLSPRGVALLIYGVCGFGAVMSLLMMSQRLQGLVILLFCLLAWAGIQHLGYVEFKVAGRMLREGDFTRLVNSQVELRAVETRIAKAGSPAEFWEVVRGAAGAFGFQAVEMVMAGEEFHRPEWDALDAAGWQVRIPLSAFDYVELNRDTESGAGHACATAFADALTRWIPVRMGDLEQARRDFGAGGTRSAAAAAGEDGSVVGRRTK